MACQETEMFKNITVFIECFFQLNLTYLARKYSNESMCVSNTSLCHDSSIHTRLSHASTHVDGHARTRAAALLLSTLSLPSQRLSKY